MQEQQIQTKKEGTLHWQGALTIQRVVELREELFRAFEAFDSIRLDFSDSSEIDPACLQLLCAGHRTATTLNKELALVGTGHFAATFRDAGFVRHVGCALDCNHNCLWVTQEISSPGEPR